MQHGKEQGRATQAPTHQTSQHKSLLNKVFFRRFKNSNQQALRLRPPTPLLPYPIGKGQGCIRRAGTSEAAPEAVRQAVRGGCQSGWGRLLSVTNAIEPGIAARETVARHRRGALEGGGGGGLPSNGEGGGRGERGTRLPEEGKKGRTCAPLSKGLIPARPLTVCPRCLWGCYRSGPLASADLLLPWASLPCSSAPQGTQWPRGSARQRARPCSRYPRR